MNLFIFIIGALLTITQAHAGRIDCANSEGDRVIAEGLIDNEGMLESRPGQETLVTVLSQKNLIDIQRSPATVDEEYFGGSPDHGWRKAKLCSSADGGVKIRLNRDFQTNEVEVKAAVPATSITISGCQYEVEAGDAEIVAHIKKEMKDLFPEPEPASEQSAEANPAAPESAR